MLSYYMIRFTDVKGAAHLIQVVLHGRARQQHTPLALQVVQSLQR